MQRNTSALTDGQFDVLVIGGGAFGAAAARDAALRGLRAALIERADFGGGASAECFKMVHGGIRYLQHLDVKRLRSSCHERTALLRIAPHLVHPLPIAIPTYGWGRRGRAFLGAGACLYDLLTWRRNVRLPDPQRRIRRTRFLSRTATLERFPHLQDPALSGAVVFEDGQMYNPARLVLAFVKGAAAAGATVCNYVAGERLLWDGDAVCGARVRDRLNGEEFDVRARLTLNAAGPWAEYLLAQPERFGVQQRAPFSRDAYFIVDRPPSCEYGVAVQGLSRDKDALLGRATRHLFVAPWRDCTLIGVWHRHFPDHPDEAHVAPQEIDRWIEELNTVHPRLGLSADEVTFANCGLVPFGETASETELSFGKESRILDHRQLHGVSGLVSLIGIRFTTARVDAARALDRLLEQHPMRTARPPTDKLPLPGGDIEDFDAFRARAHRAEPDVDRRALDALLRNHGAEYWQVLDHADGARGELIAGTTALRAELWHAVDREMAVRLEDVIMRRTDIAAGRHPGRDVLAHCAALMGERLAWSAQRIAEETASAQRTLERHLAREHGVARARSRSTAVAAGQAPRAAELQTMSS
ncbi:MAG: FAD-dependent oxidoreductase [Steroidobacteraceae bacterium]|jgi:glycerol-3-phosphate dehydrogenase|nr:FAD-dependent oxidoreductase [Steroidobacteraceae bacterium]